MTYQLLILHMFACIYMLISKRTQHESFDAFEHLYKALEDVVGEQTTAKLLDYQKQVNYFRGVNKEILD